MTKVPGIGKVLIANRGEIAVRVARTLRRLEITCAAITHPDDTGNPAAAFVDEACPVEGESPISAYLDIDQIVSIAKRIGVDAVHPGYGFLAENADFAEAVERAGIRWVGPAPETIRLMGDKIESRRFAAAHGIPVTPAASEEDDPASFSERAKEIGFPLLIKAAAGGGGKGMQIVRHPHELSHAIDLARSEAKRYFDDDRIFAERYLDEPRHVEVQIMADEHGHVVHLGERDCSIQRRFQKLVEESPAPAIEEDLRERIRAQAVLLARAAGYRNAGTVEFIVAPDGESCFLEMNTRLQVEHPVTEMVTGIDLVEEQIRVAAGHPLSSGQDEIRFEGAAIECRICAEDPERDFQPAVGRILLLRPAKGPGIRFDGGIAEGQDVTAAFDPMLAKLIVHGRDREEAIVLARQALAQTVILGCTTNLAFLERVLAHPDFISGRVETGFIPAHRTDLALPPLAEEERAALLSVAALTDRDFMASVEAVPEPYASMGDWQN